MYAYKIKLLKRIHNVQIKKKFLDRTIMKNEILKKL